ncbi:epoxyqueuosine reductase [Gorillibacterium timonense]|uniref:epoxyqueuosine reductase n=1 Tax=Gorillibacterium timonense TaxID=1689269 RepID=UPI00071DBFA7|nr:epoxyqueuosine reductase [Gorillibacterium timonense]
MSAVARLIRDKANELGYEKCGIIPVEALEEYGDKFEERLQRVPASEPFYRQQRRLISPLADYPWAKSVVVLISRYGKYKVPDNVKGHIGKSYLYDIRVDPRSREYQNGVELERYMQEELGLKTATNRKFGIVGLRWAAMQAGLGIIRRNNFFYTENGSWVHLEAWLTDEEVELRDETRLAPCPKGCSRCTQACPTGSLSEPYTMQPLSCISFLTTFGGRDLPNEPLSRKFGECIYGCDLCQDACPMNRGKWEETSEFPGLSDLAPELSPENILSMSEEFYRVKVQPKFFYLNGEELWKWKVNVLSYMRNNDPKSHEAQISHARRNEHEKVREMADSIWNELFAHER